MGGIAAVAMVFMTLPLFATAFVVAGIKNKLADTPFGFTVVDNPQVRKDENSWVRPVVYAAVFLPYVAYNLGETALQGIKAEMHRVLA